MRYLKCQFIYNDSMFFYNHEDYFNRIDMNLRAIYLSLPMWFGYGNIVASENR